MNEEYYIIDGEAKNGPYTLKELMKMDIDLYTEIITPLADKPQYASELPELNNYFEAQGIYFPTQDNIAGVTPRIFSLVLDYFFVGMVAAFTDIESGWVKLPVQPSFVLPYRDSMILLGTFAAMFLSYNIILETSKLKGSMGKTICKIMVVDIDGKSIGLINSLFRNLGVLISLMTYFFLFFSVFFSEHRQAWYDRLAKAYIITKPNN